SAARRHRWRSRQAQPAIGVPHTGWSLASVCTWFGRRQVCWRAESQGNSMRRIAHLSDLHFGTEDPLIAETLLVDLAHQEPDLVVVSGDLTQRARKSQFMAARDYLD